MNVLKFAKANKLLDWEITRVTKLLVKNVESAKVNYNKEHIIMINDIDDIKYLINQNLKKLAC